MKFKQTLRNRLIIAFFLLTLTLCGAFAVGVFSIIHGLESDLFYRHLEQDAEWLIKSAKSGLTTDLPPGIKLYIENEKENSGLPSYLKNLKSDHAEVIFEDKAYHVVVRKEGDTQYYLVQDQSQFENMEQSIGATIGIGFIIALAGSLWLGFVTANRIIAPVIELSNRVKKSEHTETKIKDLAKDYSNDEVGMLAATFGQYAQKLQDFLEREKLFTGDVSHELRTPLMVISSSCELLLERVGIDDKSRDILGRIHRASKEMRSLVDTFLTLSRQNEDLDIDSCDFQAVKIIQEEIDGTRESAVSNEVQIFFNAKEGLRIKGNPQLFRVVINNLLRNAIHHTKQGMITVTVRSDSIFVEDTGRGIPEELKDSIFERHYRISSRKNEKPGGGLGLSIVKRICDYHHWQIHLESVEPHGSCFILTLAQSSKAV